MSAPVAAWLAGRLPSEVARSSDRLAAGDGARRVAVMPDVHLEVCVGVAVEPVALPVVEEIGYFCGDERAGPDPFPVGR